MTEWLGLPNAYDWLGGAAAFIGAGIFILWASRSADRERSELRRILRFIAYMLIGLMMMLTFIASILIDISGWGTDP